MAKKENSDSEDANRLAYLQAAYNQQYELITNEIATYTMAQEALSKNKDTLDRIDNIENSKILVSMGGGTYVEASVGKISSVLTYVGAGYFVDMTIEEAKKFLSKNIEAGSEMIKQMIKDKNAVETQLLKINLALAKLQSGQ